MSLNRNASAEEIYFWNPANRIKKVGDSVIELPTFVF